MSSFKPIDPKRDEIRRYLERGNVLEPLTKLFVRVIQDRPENPMEYIQNNIGVVRYQHEKYERLQTDLHKANVEIERLREIIYSINPEALENGISTQQEEPTFSGANANEIITEANVVVPQEEQQQQQFNEIQVQAEIVNYSEQPQSEQNDIESLAQAVEGCNIEEDIQQQQQQQQQIPSVKLEHPINNNE